MSVSRRRYVGGALVLAAAVAGGAEVTACSGSNDASPSVADSGASATGKGTTGTGTTGSPTDAGTGSMIIAADGAVSMSDAGVNQPAPDGGGGVVSLPNAPDDDLTSVTWNPQLPADYNNLTANPGVSPVTASQANQVQVWPDHLSYDAVANPEVLDWKPGRIVVGAPGDSSITQPDSGIADAGGDANADAGSSLAVTPSNPFGFARRVKSVAADKSGAIQVMTEAVGLDDLFQGDMQQTMDPETSPEVNLAVIDPQWAANNLYRDVSVLGQALPVSVDDYALPDVDANGNDISGAHFWGHVWHAIKHGASSVGHALGGAAHAVLGAGLAVWDAITPASFTATKGLDVSFDVPFGSPLFTVDYTKQLTKSGRAPVELEISGQGSLGGELGFKNKEQVGISVPVPGHGGHVKAWVNVDGQILADFDLELQLEAAIKSSEGLSGMELQQKLDHDADFAQDVYSQATSGFAGDADMKPAGGWKKTLLLTKPREKTFFAGPVPVVVVQTAQVDLDCGFQAVASLNASMKYGNNFTFNFGETYENGKFTTQPPTFKFLRTRSVQITGEGGASVACSLIPRVNVYLYDMIGLNAGISAGLEAKASYESKCEDNATSTKPQGEVNVGLYVDLAIQAGARIQAPGSSYLGREGADDGLDFGPLNLWSTQIPIWDQNYEVGGLGYCAPTCSNGKKDALESDVDCGGGDCTPCAETKSCNVSSDCTAGDFCTNGKCSASAHCGDGVRDGDETGIDCGGASCTTKCALDVGCSAGSDCASGFCDISKAAGAVYGNCVQNHCADETIDADESGVDCGGATCAKCAVGQHSAVAADCVSGITDGENCVADTCHDRTIDNGESDVDCGGSGTCARCNYQAACTVTSDCANGLSCSGGKCTTNGGNVFVTNASYSGALGGAAGADAYCASAAQAANLPGTWGAYLYDGYSDPRTRLAGITGPIVRVDGVEVAASSASMSTLLAGISVSATGQTVGGEVWTNMSSSSSLGPANACNHFLDANGSDTVTPVGSAGDATYKWVDQYYQYCNRANVHLYCFKYAN